MSASDASTPRASRTYLYPESMSYVLSGIAIVVCAGIGATLAWLIVSSIGWGGIGGALLATVIGMVLATSLFALGVVLGRALGVFK